MNYPRRILDHRELYRGRRVYVKDLNVFGRVTDDLKHVACEAPLPTYNYTITPKSVLYHEAIGDRDPYDEPLIPVTICPKWLECNYPVCGCALSYVPADELLRPLNADKEVLDILSRHISEHVPREEMDSTWCVHCCHSHTSGERCGAAYMYVPGIGHDECECDADHHPEEKQ